MSIVNRILKRFITGGEPPCKKYEEYLYLLSGLYARYVKFGAFQRCRKDHGCDGSQNLLRKHNSAWKPWLVDPKEYFARTSNGSTLVHTFNVKCWLAIKLKAIHPAISIWSTNELLVSILGTQKQLSTRPTFWPNTFLRLRIPSYFQPFRNRQKEGSQL